jgi:hypothetical protein
LVSAHVQRASVVACVPGRPCLTPSPTTPQRHALGIMPPQDTFALLDFSGHDGRFPAPNAPCPSHLNVVLGRALHIVVFEGPSWTTMHIKRSGTSFCLPFSLGEQVTPSSLGMDLLLRKVLARGGRGVRGLRQPNQDHDRVSAQETVCPHNAPCPTQSIQTPETASTRIPHGPLLRLPWRPRQHRGDIIFGRRRILLPFSPRTIVHRDIVIPV